MFKNFFNKLNFILNRLSFLKYAVTIQAVKEISESVVVFQNPSTLPSIKFWSVSKAICCTVSLITAYGSQKILQPRIANAFYICCLVSTVGYKYFGGKILTSIALLILANKTK